MSRGLGDVYKRQEYMYAFAQGDTAHVVIRPSNVERCVEILNKFNCNVLTKNSL